MAQIGSFSTRFVKALQGVSLPLWTETLHGTNINYYFTVNAGTEAAEKLSPNKHYMFKTEQIFALL